VLSEILLTRGEHFDRFVNLLSFPYNLKMFRQNVRRFATTAYRAAETLAQMEGPNPYGIQLAKAQGHVNGLVGGA